MARRRTRPPDQLLTPRQAAAYINMSPAWLELARRKGFGPAFHRFGYRTVRYKESDLQHWLRQRQHPQPRQETTMEAIEQIIATCFMGGMEEPLELRVSDLNGRPGGAKVYWQRDPEPLDDGTPASWDNGAFPLVVTVKDARGTERKFDVLTARSSDNQHEIPDVRQVN